MIDRNMFADQSDLFRKSIIFYATISQETIDPYPVRNVPLTPSPVVTPYFP